MFRYLVVRFAFSVCSMVRRLNVVPYVISLVTLLNISPNLGIETTIISSSTDACAESLWSGVICISERRRGTEFCLCNEYHFPSSLIIPAYSFRAIFTKSSRVFPHKIDYGIAITSFSFSGLHITVAVTKVNILPRPISSSNSAPGISESQNHLLTTIYMAITWCARNLLLGGPGMEHL